jgi:hypothetical protein
MWDPLFQDIIKMLEILIDNIFAMFDERALQQTVGIPMGKNCSPLFADLFLYWYEADLSVYVGSFISSSMG